jgi:predicted nicotinamide N-methyase
MNMPATMRSRSFSDAARTRARLLARIHRKFATVTQAHAVGPLRLPFTRVADPDVVLDQIVAAEDRREKLTGQRRDGDDLHLPYWAELWDSGIAVGAQLADQTNWRGWLVLDLGCGMGFAGMVAAAMGANVLLADLEPDALLFAQLNTLPWRRQVRTRRLNWQCDRVDGSFDLILGADVLYDRTQWDFLEPFFRAHLRPGGTIILGEPGRQTGDLFPDWIAGRGWPLRTTEQPIPGRARPIRVFHLGAAQKIKHSPKTVL